MIDRFNKPMGLVLTVSSTMHGEDLIPLSGMCGRAVVLDRMTFLLHQLKGMRPGCPLGLKRTGGIGPGSAPAALMPVSLAMLAHLCATQNEAKMVTVGGTLFADIRPLLVVALVLGSQDGPPDLRHITRMTGQLLLLGALVLAGRPGWEESALQCFDSSEEALPFAFAILLTVALAAGLVGARGLPGALVAVVASNAALPGRREVGGPGLSTRGLLSPLVTTL